MTNRLIGVKMNKLLRYKAIQNEYLSHNTIDIPLTVIWRNYIYPKYYISKGTLQNILGTPIDKQIKELEALKRENNI